MAGSTTITIAEVLTLLQETRDAHRCDELCDGHGCLSSAIDFDTKVADFMKLLKEKKQIQINQNTFYKNILGS